METIPRHVQICYPGDPFEPEQYVPVGSSTKKISPEIHDFMNNWSTEQIVDSYIVGHPDVNKEVLLELMKRKPNHVHYTGTDMIHVVNSRTNEKEFLVLETNGVSGGQFSMPTSSKVYENHLRYSFFSSENEWQLSKEQGGLAFLYGAYVMDTPSYPHFMAEISGEPVYVVPLTTHYTRANIYNGCHVEGEEKLIRFDDGVMHVNYRHNWLPIRACFSRQTDRLWSFMPVNTKTYVYLPAVAALGGGRNKLVAQLAYEAFNQKYAPFGIQFKLPRTVNGVAKADIKSCITQHFPAGRAVVKNLYECQGRGVYVIRSEQDVDGFLEEEANSRYNFFLVQELIVAEQDAMKCDSYSFVGYETPNGDKFANTFRLTICDDPAKNGFRLVCFYGARALAPFRVKTKYGPSSNCELNNRESCTSSSTSTRDIYVTNIGPSLNKDRLLYMEAATIKGMGINLSGVVDMFVQSVLALQAIDDMATQLVTQTKDGVTQLDWELFTSLNPDPTYYISEVLECQVSNAPKKKSRIEYGTAAKLQAAAMVMNMNLD